jgi:hypothetical protein
MDVEKFVRHLCRLVLRHQMPVWNYFVNSFYSVDVKKMCQTWTDQGINKGSDRFLNFSGAPKMVRIKLAFIAKR